MFLSHVMLFFSWTLNPLNFEGFELLNGGWDAHLSAALTLSYPGRVDFQILRFPV